jgi:superfamily II DNA/RNA helicase
MSTSSTTSRPDGTSRRRRRNGSTTNSTQNTNARATASQREPRALRATQPAPATPRTSEPIGFAALGVPQVLVDVLARQGIDTAFPIQAATLPDSLAGRDVLGRGRTGSGKTIAFALPLVAALMADGRRTRRSHPRALVLLPTRELATQVHATLAPLAEAAGLRAATVFGGVSQQRQVRALESGVDILVACPGRLEDLMRQKHARLDDVMVCVLDEADHMADLGFLPGVRRILDATPSDGQRLLFSATLDNGVDVLVRRYLDAPVTHSVDDDATTEPDIDHHVLTTTAADKPAVVRELASGQGRSVLFMRTKRSARKLARELTEAGIPAVDLHGNLAQNARDRNLAAFRDGNVRVLVATDIAARGIHVDDVNLVVHVDPPEEHKAYTHRSGRTARAGASGVVVTLQTPAQKGDVAQLVRRAGISPTHVSVRPGSPELLTLTGPRAEWVKPAPAPAASSTPSRGSRGGGRGANGGGNGGGKGNGGGRGGSGQGRSRGRSGAATSTGASSRSGSKPGSSRTSSPHSGSASAPARRQSISEFSAGRRGR